MNGKWIVIGAALIGSMALTASTTTAAEEKEENEQKIDFQDIPKAVAKTLKREALGAGIKTVDLEKLDGKTVYEADVKIDGHNYEIVVDRKGMLLSKKLDEEEDQKASAKSARKAKSSDEDDEKTSAKAAKKTKSKDEEEAHDEKKA